MIRTTLLYCVLLVLVVPAPAIALAPGAQSPGSTPPTASVQSSGTASTQSSGTASTQSAVAASTQSGAIERTFAVSLTPDTPGEVEIEARFRLPDSLRKLTARLPSGATVTGTDGFEQRTDRRYEWNGETQSPTFTYTLPVNRTSTGERGGIGTGGYLYTDTGEWAIMPAPQMGLSYTSVGSDPGVESRTVVEGEGVAGETLVYLGPHTTTNRSASGQRLRLVVPEAAELAESERDILDSIERAATLDIGPRDDEIVMIAAPRTVSWGSTGLQRGAADFWVLADRRLDDPNNVWVHEYVHTRQTYRPDSSARWSIEATADYYAARLTYRDGEIGYDRFKKHLELGQRARYDEVVLADQSTWGTVLAPYDKGALAVAALDYRLHQRGTSYAAVMRVFNGKNVSNADLVAATESVGGPDAGDFLDTHTTTSATPETWSREAHAAAFGGSPAFSYSFQPPYERTGPYRNDTGTTAVTGETLTLAVRVENTGTESGEYRAVLRRNGQPVANATETLAAGESRTLTFPQTFQSADEYTFSVAGATETIDVQFPASPRVASVAAPERVAPNESFLVRTTVTAPDRPADGSVSVTVDGTAVDDRRVRLDAGATTELETYLRLTEPGEHTITVREETVTVVVDPNVTATMERPVEQTATPRGTPTAGSGAGFGWGSAVSAVSAMALLTGALRRRRRR